MSKHPNDMSMPKAQDSHKLGMLYFYKSNVMYYKVGLHFEKICYMKSFLHGKNTTRFMISRRCEASERPSDESFRKK